MEFLIPDPDIALRQGDFLISRNPQSRKIDEIYVVITADCDISKGKFGHQLACLRVLSLDTYFRTVWATRKLEKLQKEESEKLRNQVAKWHTRMVGTESQLSVQATVEWVRREEPIVISQHLKVPAEELKKFHAILSNFRAGLVALESCDEASAFDRYIGLKALSSNQDINACRQAALKQAQSETIPDDVFLLPSLPQIEDYAAVIMLREIVGLPYNSIFYRATDTTMPGQFLRVGRLQPTFKHAVSQAFGSLYSRIGLPSEYEARCRQAIQQIGNYNWDSPC